MITTTNNQKYSMLGAVTPAAAFAQDSSVNLASIRTFRLQTPTPKSVLLPLYLVATPVFFAQSADHQHDQSRTNKILPSFFFLPSFTMKCLTGWRSLFLSSVHQSSEKAINVYSVEENKQASGII